VQNAPWATRFLLQKYNITASDDLVGTSFAPWVKNEHPRRRGIGPRAKPVLTGKTFRTQKDPWRGVSRTAFGLDYLKHYPRGSMVETTKSQGLKMMELNYYDSLENPVYGYDVYAQRLSVYVQISDGEPGLPVDPDIRNPYSEDESHEYGQSKKQNKTDKVNAKERYIPKLQTLNNGSVIILFGHSQSGSIMDTLIGARQEIEQRWRKLTFFLTREQRESNEGLTRQCMDVILHDIFRALAFNWEKYIHICETHISILEDKIYDNPADESRAPELWVNSSLWLKVERAIYTHMDVLNETRNHLADMTRDNQKSEEIGSRTHPWLAHSSEDFSTLLSTFSEGVTKPTTNLADLMYKSIAIRDARHSLHLGLSMWRLSWITFIFLPLTFVSGFFGMNVDTFADNPPIKWWFMTTIPLFAVVVSIWYGVKHTLGEQRRDPLRRGVYEALFYDLAQRYPQMWTRRGPREGLIPVGWWSAVRWNLISLWFDPEQTVLRRGVDVGDEELGMWSRTKRYLVRRWLRRIVILPQDVDAQMASEMDRMAAEQEMGAVGELLQVATPVALADGGPMAASGVGERIVLERLRSLSPMRSEGAILGSGRGGSRRVGGDGDGGNGVMFEERSGDEEEERYTTSMESLVFPKAADDRSV
jgi:Mg2+ and Co2+ transporter CorA